MKKVLVLAVLGVVCFALLAACGSVDPNEAIIGSWECRDNSQDHAWYCGFTFTSDGRFTDRDGDVGSYTINGNSLTLDFDFYDRHDYTARFNSSGNRLTISDSDNGRVVLHRR